MLCYSIAPVLRAVVIDRYKVRALAYISGLKPACIAVFYPLLKAGAIDFNLMTKAQKKIIYTLNLYTKTAYTIYCSCKSITAGAKQNQTLLCSNITSLNCTRHFDLFLHCSILLQEQ